MTAHPSHDERAAWTSMPESDTCCRQGKSFLPGRPGHMAATLTPILVTVEPAPVPTSCQGRFPQERKPSAFRLSGSLRSG